MGELEPRCRRPYQERPYNLNFAFGPLGKAYSARTGSLLIGGLEIDGDERIHGLTAYHTTFARSIAEAESFANSKRK